MNEVLHRKIRKALYNRGLDDAESSNITTSFLNYVDECPELEILETDTISTLFDYILSTTWEAGVEHGSEQTKYAAKKAIKKALKKLDVWD